MFILWWQPLRLLNIHHAVISFEALESVRSPFLWSAGLSSLMPLLVYGLFPERFRQHFEVPLDYSTIAYASLPKPKK